MSQTTDLCASQFYALPSLSMAKAARLRYAIFEPPQPPQATILVALGRREFIEKKYAELGREFLERNFRVIIFEWRGQGLSDRFLSGAARQRDHITDFTLHLDDLTAFYNDVVKPNQRGRLWVLGHSMGGHLILRWLAERQKTGIQGAVLTAPMLALGPRFAHGIALGASHVAVQLGFGEHYGPGQNNYGESDKTFIDNPLSSSPERFALMERFFSAYPDMEVGGVTYGWLYAAMKSMRDERSVSYFKDVMLPILTLTGDRDRVTPVKENSRYLSQLPRVESIVLAGSLHDVLNEVEVIRAEAWKHIDRFLARV